MARRMIDDSMWANESFAEMPMGARLLMIGIINHADDQGRMKANPAYLRSRIFPYDDVSTSDIQKWLEIIQVNDTLILYLNEDKQYLQLTNWWKYQSLQYAQPSQYPRPAGWQDRIRKTLTKGVIVTCNWQKVNGDPIENTCDQDGNPLTTGKRGNSQGSDTPGTGNTNSEDTGNQSPEDSGEDTIYSFNITKNKTKTTAHAREAESPKGGSSGGGSFEPNADYAEVCSAIEQNGFGMLTPLIADEVQDLLVEYPKDWILDAMKLSVQQNKRKLSYTVGILRKWRADGRDSPRASPEVTGSWSNFSKQAVPDYMRELAQ